MYSKIGQKKQYFTSLCVPCLDLRRYRDTLGTHETVLKPSMAPEYVCYRFNVILFVLAAQVISSVYNKAV